MTVVKERPAVFGEIIPETKEDRLKKEIWQNVVRVFTSSKKILTDAIGQKTRDGIIKDHSQDDNSVIIEVDYNNLDPVEHFEENGKKDVAKTNLSLKGNFLKAENNSEDVVVSTIDITLTDMLADGSRNSVTINFRQPSKDIVECEHSPADFEVFGARGNINNVKDGLEGFYCGTKAGPKIEKAAIQDLQIISYFADPLFSVYSRPPKLLLNGGPSFIPKPS